MKWNLVVLLIFSVNTISQNKSLQKSPFFLLAEVNQHNTTPPEPCQDFYNFSCQKWFQNSQKPPHEPIWNPWIALSHEIKKRIRSILLSGSGNDTNLGEAQLFYDVCVRDSRQHLEDLRGLLKSLGGWPLTDNQIDDQDKSFDWLKMVLGATKLVGVRSILKVRVDVDYHGLRDGKNIIYIEPGNLVLPTFILTHPMTYRKELRAYKKWILETALYYNSHTSIINPREVDDIIRFEAHLAKLIRSTNKLVTSERISLVELVNKISHNWSNLGQIFFDGNLEGNETVLIYNLQYLKSVQLLIMRTRPNTVKNYIIWTVIKEVSRETGRHMRKLSFLIDRAILGVKLDVQRDFECVDKTLEHFSPALVEPYLSNNSRSGSFKIVDEMIKSIKEELLVLILKNEWLSPENKIVSSEKVMAITHHVGFPKSWTSYRFFPGINVSDNHFVNVLRLKRLKVDEEFNRLKIGGASDDGWPCTPFDVNAYYSVVHNSIFIPLGLLDVPFYDTKQPRLLNYGALGVLIGHELAHSLNLDVTEYKRRVQDCFFASGKRAGSSFLTGEETLADITGLKISLAALKREAAIGGRDVQSFFTTFAQMWCEISGKTDIFLEDEHGESRQRVESALLNNEDFKLAFDCTSKDDQCLNLW